MKDNERGQRIAITGIGVLCALGNEPQIVFERMFAAETGIGKVTRFNTDALLSSLAGQLDESWRAKALADTAEQSMDWCARYAIAAAKQALHSSGLAIAPEAALVQAHAGGLADMPAMVAATSQVNDAVHPLPASRVGLSLGTCNGGILSLEKQWNLSALDEENTANYPFYQQGDDTAQWLGVQGPVATLNTACAASGNAIGYASDMIRWGYADVMLAGGSDPLSHSVYAGFNVLRALNPLPSSPFGSRYGLNLGEGAAFVVLERLDAAVQRGATIYAELCAYGLSNDAHHMTAPHPEGAGMQRAVDMALNLGQVAKRDIAYINAHGTGTQANDRAELNGLKRSFGEQLTIPVSSSKAYFGHSLGTAAALELVTSLYAIKQGYVPATLHFDTAREGCEEVDIIQHNMRPMRPKYIVSNNAAFGGHNVSLLLRTDLSDVAAPNRGNPAPHAKRRVVITGIGAVGGGRIHSGGIVNWLAEAASFSSPIDAASPASFSLKEYDKSKYERRMNQLSQNTIGAALAALQDAHITEQEKEELGFIYGTARGSTDSISQYLESVFVKGPEYASSIYFPHTVINSVAGQTAEKLKLLGFNSSFSTGGNEGLTAALYAAGKIREQTLTSCLIGAGDERSALSSDIDRAKGLQASRFHMVEGSVCIMLRDAEQAVHSESDIYAELSGFGTAFGTAAIGLQREATLCRAVAAALDEAGIGMAQINCILLNTIGRPGETEIELQALSSCTAEYSTPPIISFNAYAGYGESYSSMLHLAAAAELVSGSAVSPYASGSYAHLGVPQTDRLQHVLVVSSTANGSYSAAVVSAWND
ncbi:beta-ketoacyl-[acyl-carrier-protein] synthase family protein [Paenibacillus sp. PCH8]|uniref:beta-ketoacyl-[acyl-carrier-protein] synthase family protein n=1 Tax=Paenibacillus sp. PCH8 TaxID=2066524 RepID=UPI0015E34829|nr:beta-ketoacyl-[acyl-carrier-protein] synthase family protein [Paenibacillus sp. PCH8]